MTETTKRLNELERNLDSLRKLVTSLCGAQESLHKRNIAQREALEKLVIMANEALKVRP